MAYIFDHLKFTRSTVRKDQTGHEKQSPLSFFPAPHARQPFDSQVLTSAQYNWCSEQHRGSGFGRTVSAIASEEVFAEGRLNISLKSTCLEIISLL